MLRSQSGLIGPDQVQASNRIIRATLVSSSRQRITGNRIGLMDLAEYFGNGSTACRMVGYGGIRSIATRRSDEGGVNAL